MTTKPANVSAPAEVNPCARGHSFDRAARANLLVCRRCGKTVYKGFERHK